MILCQKNDDCRDPPASERPELPETISPSHDFGAPETARTGDDVHVKCKSDFILFEARAGFCCGRFLAYFWHGLAATVFDRVGLILRTWIVQTFIGSLTPCLKPHCITPRQYLSVFKCGPRSRRLREREFRRSGESKRNDFAGHVALEPVAALVLAESFIVLDTAMSRIVGSKMVLRR